MSRTVLILLAMAALPAAPLTARQQAPGVPTPPRAASGERGLEVAFRAGLALSRPLARDEVGAGPPGASGAGSTGAAEVGPRPAPALALALGAPLRDGLRLEAELGWARSTLEASHGDASWEAGSASVAHAVLLLDRRLLPYLSARAGAGLIRYSAPDVGMFREGPETMPVLQAGIAGRRPLGPVVAFADLALQAHRFGTPALRRENAADGAVLRGLLRVGFALGGAR